MLLVRQSTGQRLSIHPDRILGAGGEARIYSLSTDRELVVKIYHKPTEAQANKLAAMIANPPDDPMAAQRHVSIAWPVERVQMGNPPCRFAGYLMPRVSKMRPVFNVYNPWTRRYECPLFNYRYLVHTARNLAAAVRALHQRGYVIGDVNESNILVSETALVTLVDTDSFQVRDPDSGHVYRCPVGKPEYTPPELQGKRFAELDRAPEHDLFGLAVLIFQLLMEGTHPFAGAYRGLGDPPPYEDRIANGHYPYGARSVPYRPMPAAPELEILPPSLRALFTRCFEDGHHYPGSRPDAQTWQSVLTQVSDSLNVCPDNPQHVYSNHLEACPWCLRTARLGGRDPFPLDPPVRERPFNRARSPASDIASVSQSRVAFPSPSSYGGFVNGGAPPAPLPFPRNPWAWGALGWALLSLLALPLGLLNLSLLTGISALGFGILGCRKASKLAGVGGWVSLMAAMFAVASLGARPFLKSKDLHTLKDLTGGIASLAFSPDGKILACGTSRIEDQSLVGGRVDLWDVEEERLAQELAGTRGDVVSISYSPDGNSLAVGTDSVLSSSSLLILNASTRGLYRTLNGSQQHIRQVAFSPDGKTVASAGEDNTVRLWDVTRDTMRLTLTGTAEATSLAFSPDSRLLVIGSGYPPGSIEPGCITVWDTTTGHPRWTKTAHSNSVMAVAFSPDGRTIATGGKDDTLQLWDAGTGELRKKISGQSLWVKALAFSPDSRLIASTSIRLEQEKTIHSVELWDAQTGVSLRTFTGHTDIINALAFSPDGRLLASGSRDGTIRLWRVQTP